MEKVRIGIIGTGQIGKAHLQNYAPIDEAEVVAVADLREDEARRVADEYGIPSVYTDYHELLARDDIDSVDVCLHNRLHMPVTVDALEAGKNVYCEKPMSWTYPEAQTMYDAAQRTGQMLHIQLSTLYSPETRATKKLIDEGHLGQLYYAKSCNYRRRGRPWVDGYGSPAFVNTSTSAAVRDARHGRLSHLANAVLAGQSRSGRRLGADLSASSTTCTRTAARAATITSRS